MPERELGKRLDDSADAVEASALGLHSFYTGVERILLLFSRVMNGGTCSRVENFHRHLLEPMAMSTDTRPSVLKESIQQELQEFLRLGHLLRNLYADKL